MSRMGHVHDAGYRRLTEEHVAGGAAGVRIARDVPHAGNGGRFAGWDRYESAMNTVWDDLPLHSDNSRYENPTAFAALPVEPDPLENTPLHLELDNPSTSQARHALKRIGRGFVTDATLGDLKIGLSETVGNALVYGRPPVTVRMWVHPGHVLIRVRDSGPGPGPPRRTHSHRSHRQRWARALGHTPTPPRRQPHPRTRRIHRAAPRRPTALNRRFPTARRRLVRGSSSPDTRSVTMRLQTGVSVLPDHTLTIRSWRSSLSGHRTVPSPPVRDSPDLGCGVGQ